MSEEKKLSLDLSLDNVITTAIQVPGVKISRTDFLKETFKKKSQEEINLILEKGTIEFGCTQQELKKIAERILYKRTIVSTGISFATGLPGGLAMAATIPADVLQFYANALGLAQEIAYLYGEEDLWSDNVIDEEKVRNQLILYCGVMLGSAGASQAVKIMSSSLAKRLLRQLPQKALTKGFVYPIVKSIARFFGVNMTKNIFAKGVSKVVPILGGVVSGGITFATLKPMGQRLINAFDESKFGYSQEAFEADWEEIVNICEDEENNDKNDNNGESKEINVNIQKQKSPNNIIEEIKNAKELLDNGIITESEFSQIKENLIKEM